MKGTREAKSRFGGTDNRALALAMALDTVEAALAVAPVIVVTTDGEPFVELGATVIADPGAGLNAAIAAGLDAAATSQGKAKANANANANESGTAVLLGDLPGVRPSELAAALDAAGGHPLSIVADADGTGTALAAATAGDEHRLAFGAGSRGKHVANGYIELLGDWPGLRRDIDTAEQLASIEHLGARTAALLLGRGTGL